VFWVYASNASRFEQSYRDIADYVKISGRRNPKANVFKLVHDWLRGSKAPWLLILDNVDDAGFLLKPQPKDSSQNTRPLREYLPQSQSGSILLTTRSREAASKLVEQHDMVDVEPMDKGEATALLKKKLGGQDGSDDDKFAELADALDFMPLAIVQAAAYISQRVPRCSVRQYLQEFRKSDREKTSLLDNEAGHLRRDWEAKNSIILTWHISFNHMRETQPSAADLLSLMSFFDRQGIPEAIIHRRAKKKRPRGLRYPKHLFNGNREHFQSQHAIRTSVIVLIDSKTTC
jgi:hypothetical protein